MTSCMSLGICANPLTLLYGQIPHGQSHGVAGEYVIPAENMLAID